MKRRTKSSDGLNAKKLRNLTSKGKTGSDPNTLRVAIAQFAPVYLDKTASVSRAIELIQDAKKRGEIGRAHV